MARPTRRLALAAAVAVLAPLTPVAAAPAPTAVAGRAAVDPAAPRLWAPATATAALYGRRQQASVSLDVRLVAGEVPLEVWSTRTSYAEPVRSVLRTPAGDVALPAGAMPGFGALRSFLAIEVTDARTGARVRTASRDACLNGYGQRVRPDAPARSPYPHTCAANPYSTGSVQGIQAGWSQPVLDRGLRLPRGRYVATIRVRPQYAAAFGLVGDAATRTVAITVSREEEHPHGPGGGEPGHGHRSGGTADPAGADGPTGRLLDARAAVEGPVPNLRSVPAWGIDVARNGDFLRFSATVWNAGPSPLVVDGFVSDTSDRMDAYQYFFDADGEQTGYQPVGSFEFDRKRTHQHWHFRDFATYTLLRADKTTAVVSRKEAFCLANTDSVDLTVPDADWDPENTDLATDCGFEGSVSLRQVLAAGWGDTYAQFRAGQSFDLRGLPNGTYHIATIANPRKRLVESSTDDNTALRTVVIGGRPGARTVRVPQVGLVVEPSAVG